MCTGNYEGHAKRVRVRKVYAYVSAFLLGAGSSVSWEYLLVVIFFPISC